MSKRSFGGESAAFALLKISVPMYYSGVPHTSPVALLSQTYQDEVVSDVFANETYAVHLRSYFDEMKIVVSLQLMPRS